MNYIATIYGHTNNEDIMDEIVEIKYDNVDIVSALADN